MGLQGDFALPFLRLVWFAALFSCPDPPRCLALLGTGRGWSPCLAEGVGAGQRPVLSMLLEPVRRGPDELELNAIFVRVPFSSVNANPELQAIRMTS